MEFYNQMNLYVVDNVSVVIKIRKYLSFHLITLKLLIHQYNKMVLLTISIREHSFFTVQTSKLKNPPLSRSRVVICHSIPQFLQEKSLGTPLGNNSVFRSQQLQFIQRFFGFKWDERTSHDVTRHVIEETRVMERLQVKREVHPFMIACPWIGFGAVFATKARKSVPLFRFGLTSIQCCSGWSTWNKLMVQNESEVAKSGEI